MNRGIEGQNLLDPEELYLLLPEDGEHLGFEAVRAAVSEQSERDVTEEELAQCIFVLGGQKRVDWLPDEKQLRRKLLGLGSHPPSEIAQEKDLEPWFERYLWLNARTFYDPRRGVSVLWSRIPLDDTRGADGGHAQTCAWHA